MKSTIDKAGRVVIPAALRARAGLRPGAELEVVFADGAIRILRRVAGPTLERRGKRLVAIPTVLPKDRSEVDLAHLVEEERNRWPW